MVSGHLHLPTRHLHLHIARPGQDVCIVQEPTGAEETFVAHQLAHNLRIALGVPVVQIVHRAHVVHAAARHKVARVGVRHTHDPGRTERYHLHLVPGPGVPDDQLAIQRAGHAVPRIARKVHRVDLVDVALEELFRGDAHLRHVAQIGTLVEQLTVGYLFLFLLFSETEREKEGDDSDGKPLVQNFTNRSNRGDA